MSAYLDEALDPQIDEVGAGAVPLCHFRQVAGCQVQVERRHAPRQFLQCAAITSFPASVPTTASIRSIACSRACCSASSLSTCHEQPSHAVTELSSTEQRHNGSASCRACCSAGSVCIGKTKFNSKTPLEAAQITAFASCRCWCRDDRSWQLQILCSEALRLNCRLCAPLLDFDDMTFPRLASHG